MVPSIITIKVNHFHSDSESLQLVKLVPVHQEIEYQTTSTRGTGLLQRNRDGTNGYVLKSSRTRSRTVLVRQLVVRSFTRKVSEMLRYLPFCVIIYYNVFLFFFDDR